MADRHIRVRLPEDMLRAMERILADRPNVTLDDIVEAAIAMWLAADEATRIDASIVAGYTRFPVGPDEEEFGRISDRAQAELDAW